MTNCIQTHSKKRFTLAANRMRAEFLNPEQVKVDEAQVDGCLIVGPTPRCDHFVRTDDKIWLVELKGRAVERAVAQIEATVAKLEKEIGGRECIPVIVTTRSPALANQKFLLALHKCKCRMSKRIVLRTRIAKITI